MRIKPEHYEYIKNSIKDTIEYNGIDRVKQYYNSCKKNKNVHDPKIRIMYDLKSLSIKSDYIIENLYPYMNDNHLTTALLKIGYELGIYEN